MLEKIRQSLKPGWKSTAVELLVFVLMYAAIRAWMQRDLPQGAVPPMQAITLAGEPVDIARYGRGRPVLIHFWATWCSVCRLEQGSINAISRDYPVLTIATQSGSGSEVQGYLQKNQLHFPVVLDDSGELLQRFGLHGVPASFIIDPRGNIAYREVGYTTGWGLRLRLWLAT
ncbi:MAG: redoxin domain-containing protein [Gammaproteobacteria bacterium]|nr:redoxin domain-containing protein [Gammaproteobacteria bacterium]